MDREYYLAIPAICAVIAYQTATKKRRNAPVWAIICFVFPLALPFLLRSRKAIVESAAYLELRQKWSGLVAYDADIKAAAERLSPLGEDAVDRFKRIYSEFQDKSSIPLIVADIEQQWAERQKSGLRLHETSNGVQILIDPNGQYHVEGRVTGELRTARTMAAAAARSR